MFVCNGSNGGNGDPGDPGADGQDGQDGQNGLDGQDGQAGTDGFDGRDGSGSASDCGAGTVKLRLPARFRRARSVTLTVAGDRGGVPVTRRAITVHLEKLACGSYPAVVQRRGIRPFVRILTLHAGGRVSREAVR
jgi:hypothetical protein